ncbi:MAG: AIR synthase related protein [Nitrososphaerales archaeon]|nr:AIR synthase related protein [Nitrososphaerales archaeon]
MERLGFGKIPIKVLGKTVLRMTGVTSARLLTGPNPGVDFAAVKVDGGYMIVSSDPITGVSSGIGEYAVVVSANDVATSGNAPQFMESIIMMPEDSTSKTLGRLAADMDAAAKRLGISVVGGHTEVTPGLKRPIVVVTAFSFVRSFVSSEMATAGDAILMTKTAGLEGTAVLAREARRLRRPLPSRLASDAVVLEKELSIVKEATAGFSSGHVHAMHDCTEGGVVGAAYEMSLASGLGFELYEEDVPVARVTREVCRRFSLDPLRLIGSGSLLIAVPESEQGAAARAIGKVAEVTRVGRFRKRGRFLVRADGKRETVGEAPADELWRALGRSR